MFNTWPLIDGAFIPSAERLFFEQPWWRNFFDNMLTVQFTPPHAGLRADCRGDLAHAIDAVRYPRGAQPCATAALWLHRAATLLQAVLGILTLLNGVPIDLALAHQAGAVLVLTLVLLQVERLGARPARSDIATAPAMVGASA